MLARIRELLEKDPFIQGLVLMQGKAAKRMKHNDHSKKHVLIVAERALELYHLLREAGIKGDLEKEGYSQSEVEAALYIAAYLHDVGIGISRDHHEAFSVCLVSGKVWETLSKVMEPKRAAPLTVEILHMIRQHRSEGKPLTLEGEIVRLADALDMERGRAAKEAGVDDMHKISALAIEKVEVKKGKRKPIRIEVWMRNMSGMFHVTHSLKRKVGERLGQMVELVVFAEGRQLTLME